MTKVVNDNATRLAHAQDMLKALNEFKSKTPKQALDDKTKRETLSHSVSDNPKAQEAYERLKAIRQFRDQSKNPERGRGR